MDVVTARVSVAFRRLIRHLKAAQFDVNECTSLHSLRAIPRIAELRDLLAKDDFLVSVFMANMKTTNRELYQRILDYWDDFQPLFLADDEIDNAQAIPPAPRLRLWLDSGDYLDTFDEANLATLKSMGFEDGAALEAYVVCDRNLERTVEFLLADVDQDARTTSKFQHDVGVSVVELEVSLSQLSIAQ